MNDYTWGYYPTKEDPLTTARSAIALLLVVLASLMLPAVGVSADNTKDATAVVSCSYTYNGHAYDDDGGMYVLDPPARTNRANLESRQQYYAMWRMAGTYNHEYIDYPNYPTTVVPADLHGWRCTWSTP